jgi:5-methylcytosine-specific restriction endonuclease McrA
MSRAIPEWVAKHDDQAIPERVMERVLKRQRNADGIPVCPLCNVVIRPGDGVDYDHETPLIDGGSHAESNLRAVHRKCHRLLTARQAQTRAEERSQFRAVYGIKRSGNGFATNRNGKFKKRMDGTVIPRTTRTTP